MTAEPVAQKERSVGVSLLTAFFCFGVLMSGLATGSLLTPGGWLEPIWRINPDARAGFAEMGSGAIALLMCVCLACGFAAYGLWHRVRWGHRLATAILVVNLFGDGARAFVDPRAAIGVPIAGVLISYLLLPRTRRLFGQRVRGP